MMFIRNRFSKFVCHRSINLRNISILTKYNEKEQDTILTAVNKGSENDLVRFSLGKLRAQILKKTVEENGKFEDLKHIYEFLNLKENSFSKFCDLILNQNNGGSVSKLKFANIISSKTSSQELKKVESVVGVSISGTSFTWAEVNRDFILKDWTTYTPSQSSVKKMTPGLIFDAVSEVCTKLPEADVFILESSPALLPQQVYMHSYIQKREIQATLLTLLNLREPIKHRVHFLKSKISSRLYGTQIGSECVSLKPLMEDLLNGGGVGPNNSTFLQIEDPEIGAIFRSESGIQKEIKSSVLILALTFLKLAVLEDQDCLKALKLL